MCSCKTKPQRVTPKIAETNGRPVLQLTSNQVPSSERRNSLKKNIASPKSPNPSPLPLPPLPTTTTNSNNNVKTKSSLISPPISPKLKSPRPPAIKRGSDANELESSAEKIMIPRCTTKLATLVKKPKRISSVAVAPSCDSSLIVEAPGSIAAARREQVAIMQEQRKLRIAHYGRTKSAKYEAKELELATALGREKNRCSFITPNSDPIYVAFHHEEWGVPVRDDKLLFELLLLTGAQVGSDWTAVLKKRQALKEAFAGFDAEVIAKFTEKRITSVRAEYGIDISQVRGVVDNSKRILEVKKGFGSFDR